MTPMKRREFLQLSAAASVLTLGFTPGGVEGRGDSDRKSPIPGLGPESPVGPAPHPLRILVLGGTGFIGPHQVRYARSRGHRLTLFNRGRTDPDLFPGVETLIGDRNDDLEALRGWEWDAVIDNSGFYPRWVRDTAELLVDSVDRYLFVSSISAYSGELEPGDDEFSAPKATMEDPTDESDPPYGPTYGARKALCEEALLDVFGPDRSIIVRPGQITGPGDPTDRVNYWLSRMLRGGDVLVPGDPDDPVQMIDARDLTGWMVRLVEQGESGPYNGVGPESPLTMAGFVHAARAVTSSALRFTWVDESFLADHEVVGRYVFPWAPESFQAFTRVTNQRALEAGLTYLPLARTLFDMLDDVKTAGPEGIEPTLFGRLGVSPEQEAELLAEWRAGSTGSAGP